MLRGCSLRRDAPQPPSQMRALLQAVSDAWHNGGSGSMPQIQIACIFGACYHGAASVLDGRERGERMERWMFFIADGEGLHCVQLEGPPKEVTYTSSPAIENLPSHGNVVVKDEQHIGFDIGLGGARRVLAHHSNYLANAKLISIVLSVPRTREATGAQEETRSSMVQLHMWRRDVVEAVQAQYGLPDVASVPCKVWRALGRASVDTLHDLSIPCLRSFDVAALLVCWQCGVMPDSVRQCSRCGRASYCCKEHQRAHYGSSHRRWCKQLAAGQRADEPASAWASHAMHLRDMVAAVQRNPQAAALCNPTADEPLPAQVRSLDLLAALHEDERGRPGPACNERFAACARSPLGRALLALDTGRAGGAGPAPAAASGAGA